jgi:tripartite-type tricarboxylate transporter receptor subunit TctC
VSADRVLIAAASLLVAVLFSARQTYPARAVRLVIGFPPGGGVDINARLLAPKLAEYLGQPFIVDNRPGAGTNIANEIVARAAPDGYTLLMNTGALAINMSLYRNLPFDALRDFTPVSVFSESPNVLVVNAKVPYASMKELLAAARAAPGKLNYSSAGVGTTQHLAAELLKMRTGTSMVHIPYKGTAPSLTALLPVKPTCRSRTSRRSTATSRAGGCARSQSPRRSAIRSCPTCLRRRRPASIASK